MSSRSHSDSVILSRSMLRFIPLQRNIELRPPSRSTCERTDKNELMFCLGEDVIDSQFKPADVDKKCIQFDSLISNTFKSVRVSYWKRFPKAKKGILSLI